MTLAQAIAYFTREALVSLLRSWKVSLLAILTIAVSLSLAGTFLLVGDNLASVVRQWRGESKIVVYLESDSDPAARAAVHDALVAEAWVRGVERIDADEARRRFVRAFPSMGDLLEGWGDEPLPPSIEIDLDWQRAEPATVDAWLALLRAEPAVSMVDDDRDWLRQLEAVVVLLRGVGIGLGAILLVTAVFTIASVIRLTAYLYRDEIAVMRLVGATEFFIRGPFYIEGLLQGFAGGALAVGALFTAHLTLVRPHADTVLMSVLARDFLSLTELAALIVFGSAAGLIGAIASLRKEDLGRDEPTGG